MSKQPPSLQITPKEARLRLEELINSDEEFFRAVLARLNDAAGTLWYAPLAFTHCYPIRISEPSVAVEIDHFGVEIVLRMCQQRVSFPADVLFSATFRSKWSRDALQWHVARVKTAASEELNVVIDRLRGLALQPGQDRAVLKAIGDVVASGKSRLSLGRRRAT